MKASGGNTKPAVDLSTIRCNNCLEMGHFKSSCLAPRRPTGTCYMCSEVGHRFLECPKRKTTSTAAVKDKNILTGQLDAVQLVSVAFISRDKCIEVKRVSLFDSGSPISFIRKSLVPIKFDEQRGKENYFGMGGGNIKPCGHIRCKITFRGVSATHEFIIVPDEKSVSPLIVGRDLLSRLNIGLCLFKIRYSSCELLKLNKMDPWNKNTVSAIMSFNLFKSPDKLDFIGAHPLNQSSRNVSSVYLFDTEQSVHESCVNDVSSVDVELECPH